MAKITLIGLNNYDDNLWKNFSLPDGYDKETVKNVILMNDGEYGLLYPDADFMEFLIGIFCEKYKWTFTRLLKAINIEYDPLYNYDRTEEETLTIDRTSEETTKNNGSNTSESNVTSSGENENKTSAYNSNTYTPHDESISSNTSNGTGKNTNENTENVNENSNDKHDRKMRAYGNIGVTTSQQMLKEEFEVSMYNIYDTIAELFADEFCVKVYA